MGILDGDRNAYGRPDPEKIFNKIMDWLESNYVAVSQDQAKSQLAEDFMKGWDADNSFESKQLGLLAANGQINPEDLDEVKRLSMLRGVEEWDMMLACARSMKSKKADQHSLEGQDTLSYLAKLWKPNSPGPRQEALHMDHQVHHTAVDGAPPPDPDTFRPVKKKRKRRQTESHYFADTPALPPSTPQRQQQQRCEESEDVVVDAGEDGRTPEQRARKKAKNAARRRNRKAKRALQQQQSETQGEEPSEMPTEANNKQLSLIPQLKEAAVWYRSGDSTRTAEKATTNEHRAQQSALPSPSSSSLPDGGDNADTAYLKEIRS
jgi:hypothetical protein